MGSQISGRMVQETRAGTHQLSLWHCPCGFKTVEGHWNKLNRKHPECKATGPEDKVEDTTIPSG